jgi:uncharacterized membrane protein YjjP (DUF1212 family)
MTTVEQPSPSRATERTTDQEPGGEEPPDLQAFLVQLGAALNAIGEPVDSIEVRLTRVAAANGVDGARISAFPTSLFTSLGDGKPTTIERTTPLDATERLDQIAALDQLADDAENHVVLPTDGLDRLAQIRSMPPRFPPLTSVLGYAVLTVGIALILHPAARDIAAAAFFGAIVGSLRLLSGNSRTLKVLMPVVAAFCISGLTALAVEQGLADPGLRAMIASLVVFVPGAALTTAVLELTAGDMIAGSSRLVWAGMHLALLVFGILAGVEAVGIPSTKAFSSTAPLLGGWAPWLGVLVFATGVFVANSAPHRSFLGLLTVLYAAWVGQIAGNALLGAYASGLVGALAMTAVAALVARLPSGMPVYASFLPGFWLLVPGSMSLIGLTKIAAGTDGALTDALAAAGSIVGVALGVLCGARLVRRRSRSA